LEKPDTEKISLRIEQKWNDTEQRIMDDVVRRIKKNRKITSTADYQINRLIDFGKSTEEIEKTIKEALNYSNAQMYELYDEVINWEYVRTKELYEQINANFVPAEENEYLKQLSEAVRKQTEDELVNLSRSYGFSVMIGKNRVFTPFAEYYQNYVDTAIMDMVSGGFDYNAILKRVVSQMTNSGLRSVDYASGHSNRTPVAVRRAVMTGYSQITGQVSMRNASKLGTNYFEVEWHAGARNTGSGYFNHQSWQGKVYTAEQLRTVCGYGEGGGLLGWNCYHIFYPFFPGLSERNYTDAWLKEQNKKENTLRKYNEKEYDYYGAVQQQRKSETAMRAQREKIRLLQSGDADQDIILNEQIKYQNQLYEYVRFSNAMGLKQDRARIYMDMKGKVAPDMRKLLDKGTKHLQSRLDYV
jgi:hypothetical protein